MTATRRNARQLPTNTPLNFLLSLFQLKRFTGLLTLMLLSALPGAALGQTVINIPDPHLEAAVRAQLHKPTGDLTSEDMLGLTELGAPAQGITSLEGLQAASNLQHLNLEDNAVSDATPLAGLTQLQNLFMDNNHLSSGAPLAGLTNLQVLLLDNNSIQDASWLAELTQLQSLSLMFNSPLANCSVIGRLTKLTELHLNGTGISEASFLSNLTDLTILGLGDNAIHNGTPLAGLTKLEFLGLGANPISNWDFMQGLTHLKTLYLFSDAISDLSFLANLKSLTWLRLADNHITDASALAGLTQLQYLDLSWNALGSLPSLAGLTQLTTLDLSYNALTNLNGLSGLGNLTILGLGNNQVQDGSPLAGLTKLLSLDLNHNRLADLTFAQGMTALTQLDASYNRLTDINGLLGAVSLRSVNLSNNLLLLATGSSAQTVIQTLQGRGATVDASSQSLPYVPTNGTYNGLFYSDVDQVTTNSGCITLTTTTGGKYTGKLRLGTKTYALSGTLKTDGTDTKHFLQKGKQPALVVNLVMQGADYLTGTVSTPGQSATADILAYRAVYDGKNNRAPQAGRYTLAVAGSTETDLPAGNGYGTFTITSAGRLSFAGSLADGTKVSQSACISADGQWPCYAPLYSGIGCVVGWLGFTNNQALAGDLAWAKPSAKTRLYPKGFSWLTQAVGARYTAPGKGTNAFNTTSCTVTLTLSGGDLKQDLVRQFTLNAKSQVKDLPTGTKLNLVFTPSTGLFKGRTIDSTSHKTVSFNGVILQGQTNGIGYFLGNSTSGQVFLNQ